MMALRALHHSSPRWAFATMLLAVTLAVAGCAGTAVKPKPSAGTDEKGRNVQVEIQSGQDPALDAQLDAAKQLVLHGDFMPAIQGPIARILARFPGKITDGGTRYYSTTTPGNAFLYAGLDNGKYTHIEVMSGAWVEALFLEGYAYNSLKRFGDARDALSRATALSPFNPHLFNELGFTYEQLKDWPDAMQAFKNAESAAEFLDGKRKIDEQTRAIRGQGYVLVALGKYDQAVAAYQLALKIDPGDVRSMGELNYIRRVRQAKPQTR